MRHSRNSVFVLAAFLAPWLVAATMPVCTDAAPVVNVEVGNLGDETLEDVPVTFGQVFKKGDVPAGEQVHCLVDGAWAQIDAKRRYDDGSLRLAVISTAIKELPGKGTKTLNLIAGAPRPGAPGPPVTREQLLATDFDAVVRLTLPDGVERSASARQMLEAAGENERIWLRGHVATEWLLCGPPTDSEGRPDEDLNVQFQVRAYAGCKRVRVSVVVENCWDTWAGNIRYDAEMTIAGKKVFAAKAVDHRRLARWRKVFWYSQGEPPVHVAHDLGYLSATGALPNYDRTLELPESRKDFEKHLAQQGPRYEIMGQGTLTAYMPTTGGREEIAPYPAWTVRYLLSMDPRYKRLVLANGDLAGSWPIHVRARKTRRIMTIDERPEFWLDGRGKDRPTWQADRQPPGSEYVRLSPDMAHQPSLAYVPYLVTGDYYYLEEAYFWANFCLLATWPHPRHDAEGILAGQVRGNAWSLRNIADAAWIASQGDPEVGYFDEKIRNNLADRTRRMLGPPEYNKLGLWHPRTVQNARIHNAANPNWVVNVPWELDYLTWSFHHLVELDYAEAARPRDFLLRQRVGMLTNAPDFDPMLSTPYRCVIGEENDGTIVFYEDWKTLGRENARLSKPGLPNYGGGYAYSARAAAICGLDGGFPKAAEAVEWLEENLDDYRNVMARELHWAIAPGGAAAKR